MVQRAVSSLVLSNNTKVIICRSIMFTFALYQHATWYLTWVEEHTLRVSENRALRNVFGHKRKEVTGEWRRSHNKELLDWYCSPDVITVITTRMMIEAGHVARTGGRDVVLVRIRSIVCPCRAWNLANLSLYWVAAVGQSPCNKSPCRQVNGI